MEEKLHGIRPAAGAGGPEYPEGADAGDLLARWSAPSSPALCAQEAYDAGCREVVMNWHDDALGRMKYLHAADEVFDTVPLWRRHFFNDYALEGAAYLAISASGPGEPQGRGLTAGLSGPSRPAERP